MSETQHEPLARLSDPDSKCGRLQRACLILIRGPRHAESDAIPTSVRFLYYELVQDDVIPKHYMDENGKNKARKPSQDVSDALGILRELELIPWEWIKDETRRLRIFRTAASIQQFIADTIELARINPWGDELPPMILTESKSLAGVLEDIAYLYAVPIAATGGQVGGFLHTDIIPALTAEQRVLYFGDEDNAGHQIENNTRRVIEAKTGPLQWERLALTPEQVREYNIPPQPKTDRRFKNGGGESVAYETEALSQIVIQDILRSRLDALLPNSLEAVQVREAKQRAEVAAFLNGDFDNGGK